MYNRLMQEKIEKIINILNSALKKEFPDFKGAYLYGSYTKGKVHEDSDIDIVALFEKTPDMDRRFKIWSIVGPIEAHYDVFLDLHPMTKEELEYNQVYYNEVVNKGVFYDAA